MRPSVFQKPKVVLSQPWTEIPCRSKFGMRVVFHLPIRVQSLNLNPKVDFRLYSRQLKNRYDVITPPSIVLVTMKSGRKMHI